MPDHIPNGPASTAPHRCPEDLVRRLLSDAEDIRTERIATGKFNTSYFVESTRGHHVLRIAPAETETFVFYERGMMRREPRIHQLVREHTRIPIPRIVACDTSRTFADRDYMLMDRLPGVPLTEAPRSSRPGAYEAAGRMLAESHAIRGDAYGYPGDDGRPSDRGTWRDAFTSMWRRLVEDVRDTGCYTPAEACRLFEVLEARGTLFDRDVEPSLLHMDVWHQNILVGTDGRVTGLLDWDRALFGDPEIEFAVLDYCGVSIPAFWQGYGCERDRSPEARIRRIFYLLYEMQKYIVICHGRERDPEAAGAHKRAVAACLSRHLGEGILDSEAP